MTFAAEVGRRIRDLRRTQGLSLSELAHRAGVGKATISGLESGTRNPTLETLYAITAQLGVPLATVLTDPVLRPTVHGTAVSATLLQTFEDPGMTTELYRIVIRPGRVQLSPAHPKGVTEHLTVFTGTARVGPVDAPILIPAGGYETWPADVPHAYAAETDEEVHAALTIRHPA